MSREAENVSPKLNKIFILFSLLHPANVSSPQSFNIKSGGWVMLQANQTEMS